MYVGDAVFIINYEFPICIEEYVEIERSRSKEWTQPSFSSHGAFDDLICMLRKANQETNPQLYELEKENRSSRLWPMGIILQYTCYYCICCGLYY